MGAQPVPFLLRHERNGEGFEVGSDSSGFESIVGIDAGRELSGVLPFCF